jgi:chemotaxis protein methyltransferase CheR
MRDSEFEFIRSLIYERSRISLDHNKRELVAARVARRLRANHMMSVSDYCRLLQAPDQEDERARLIDDISTNHTFFFRERAHFEFVAQRILPELLARSRPRPGAAVRAWSAACSSGEEPYSLGMTLAEQLAGTPWGWQIEATDISHRMLEMATDAVYPQKAVLASSPSWARRYFLRGTGPQTGNYRVKPAIRDGVTFRQLNLLDHRPPAAKPFHLIFCRNVMIYFDAQTQQELVRQLAERLAPGGYLIVGHAESLNGLKQSLELVQPSIYRRPLAA